ncbi:MAG: IS630 family transposase [bacterium]
MRRVTRKPRRLLKKLSEKVAEIRSAGEQVNVFFFDEARFGLQPCVGRVLCRRGVKPVCEIKPGYSNLYAYSAVDVENGDEFSLLLPEVNTETMNIFLDYFHRVIPENRVLLIMDQAGWHKSKSLKIPENIEILFLPPYSPELNPVERLWQWLRRHFMRNRIFDKLSQLVQTLLDAWNCLSSSILFSLCRCSYL